VTFSTPTRVFANIPSSLDDVLSKDHLQPACPPLSSVASTDHFRAALPLPPFALGLTAGSVGDTVLASICSRHAARSSVRSSAISRD
jgi:hypothetical protein